MIDDPHWLLLLLALLGFAFGLAYFESLRRTADLFVAGRGWLQPIAHSLMRLSGAVILFWLAARLGALPLLAGFAGFVAARLIALRAKRVRLG